MGRDWKRIAKLFYVMASSAIGYGAGDMGMGGEAGSGKNTRKMYQMDIRTGCKNTGLQGKGEREKRTRMRTKINRRALFEERIRVVKGSE